MTPNGLPRMGPCPIANNVYVPAGHNMLGMSMAPATGQLIAQMIDRAHLHSTPSLCHQGKKGFVAAYSDASCLRQPAALG
ncbi:MAG: hypothetical protein CM1200mP41_01450 [Gammaproteobacteria bacterium]|nr:MAG: hypothetical protein CM1200mP41_01450 [Gammaproteobacteria bacterium]